MKDLTIALENRPGALAEAGAALGRAGVSIEGGGAWVVDGKGVAHFLFHDGSAARSALEAAGIRVLEERDVLIQKLKQDEPGQLGTISSRMAAAGVNIEAMYSDHDHQLILVVDDVARGRAVSEAWSKERAQPGRSKHHTYEVRLKWTGNTGEGTKTYRSYRRDHIITAEGKPPIEGSSDPGFRGDAARYSPEELLVASLSSCHMLWYLHLCSVHDVNVLEYRDGASGVMSENEDGSGEFVRVTLKPEVTIRGGDTGRALALHSEAHHLCFIARSVRFPVEVDAAITFPAGSARPE